MSLLFNMLSRFVVAFLPKSKCLLISWLQSPSAVILEPKKLRSVTVSIVSPSICQGVMGPYAMIFVFWMLSQLFTLLVKVTVKPSTLSSYLKSWEGGLPGSFHPQYNTHAFQPIRTPSWQFLFFLLCNRFTYHIDCLFHKDPEFDCFVL